MGKPARIFSPPLRARYFLLTVQPNGALLGYVRAVRSESYDAADWGRVEFLRCLNGSVQPRCARTGYVMRLGDRVRTQATVLYARREQDMGAEWSAARTRSGTWTWWEHVKRNCMALVDIAPMSFLLLFLILISGFGNKPKKHKSKVGAKTHTHKKNPQLIHLAHSWICRLCEDFSCTYCPTTLPHDFSGATGGMEIPVL